MLGVLLRRVVVVLDRVQVMAVSDLRMMRGLFVIAGFVVLRRLAMMLGRVLVVMRGFLMMLVDVVTAHRSLPG
jgi:hypothetical protein